jgi:hypothetical protein
MVWLSDQMGQILRKKLKQWEGYRDKQKGLLILKGYRRREKWTHTKAMRNEWSVEERRQQLTLRLNRVQVEGDNKTNAFKRET